MDHDAVAQDALREAFEEASWPDSDEEGVLWGTFRTITDRAIADYHEKRTARRKYQGRMPEAPTREDEAGERVPDEEKDIDPALHPDDTDERFEGLLLRRFLARAVKGNARDEETYGWFVAWADEDKTYEQIAIEANVNRNTVHSRIHEFKKKYLPRYREWRNRTVLLLLLFAGAAVVAWWLAAQLAGPRGRKVEEILPSPDVPLLAPSASGSGQPEPGPAPPEPSFDNALPTQPDRPLQPDKPPADDKPKAR
jgi:DNA-directed RNA polymerase specialized sigma24 family protein